MSWLSFGGQKRAPARDAVLRSKNGVHVALAAIARAGRSSSTRAAVAPRRLEKVPVPSATQCIPRLRAGLEMSMLWFVWGRGQWASRT